VIFFIGAVQCAFWAREYAITPDDLKMWEFPRALALQYQKVHYINFHRWIGRMNRAYRFGILFLLSGAAVTLVPRGSAGLGREAAIAIISLGFIVELLWILAQWVLAGSPSLGFTYTDEAPLADVRFKTLRSWKPIRRLARAFVPYAELSSTSSGDKETG
jgi:hypothetical protein